MSAARIVLEPLREAHATELFALLNDPELWRYTDDEPPQSLPALAARYRRLESRRSPDGRQQWLNWAVVTPGGIAGFVQATIAQDVAEIAYVVGARFQSRGIAREGVAAMLRLLRDEAGVSSYRATVDARNVRSVGLLQQLGFALVDAVDVGRLKYARSADAPTTPQDAPT